MRRTVLALALLAAVPACSLFRKGKLTDSTPAHTPAQTSSPFGEWVLSTDPNRTAFAGARRVELSLTPSNFRMVAIYPAEQVVITGSASITPSGLLTLMPQTTTTMASGGRPPILAGQTIQVLASAADNTMVFAPPAGMAPTPSSVWHRVGKAREAAGQLPVPARTAATDSL